MFEKYKEAKFVLSGRGQLNLDCFRIYEAIIAGALPVRPQRLPPITPPSNSTSLLIGVSGISERVRGLF